MNNFFVYKDPGTQLFSFIPWGVDSTFASAAKGFTKKTDSVMATGVLAWRLYRYKPTRDRYIAKLQQLLSSVWNGTELLQEVDRMVALISPFIVRDSGRFSSEVASLKDFINARRARIEKELANPPVWDVDLVEHTIFCNRGKKDSGKDATKNDKDDAGMTCSKYGVDGCSKHAECHVIENKGKTYCWVKDKTKGKKDSGKDTTKKKSSSDSGSEDKTKVPSTTDSPTTASTTAAYASKSRRWGICVGAVLPFMWLNS